MICTLLNQLILGENRVILCFVSSPCVSMCLCFVSVISQHLLCMSIAKITAKITVRSTLALLYQVYYEPNVCLNLNRASSVFVYSVIVLFYCIQFSSVQLFL